MMSTNAASLVSRSAGSGEAILFIAPRERNMLRAIERATRQPIEAMNLPTLDDVNQRRIARFKQRIAHALEGGDSSSYRGVVEEFTRDSGADIVDVAAALASLAQGRTPLLLNGKRAAVASVAGAQPAPPAPASAHGAFEPPRRTERKGSRFGPQQTYRLQVGRAHGVQPGKIGRAAGTAR